jgi:gliding motility-associated-like protein
VFVHAEGIGNFEYSLDGIHFQNTANFTHVLPGKYTIEVKDTHGCGSDFYTIYVLNYPTYFTPNDDGYHDVWSIENLDSHAKAEVSIFDRYGKYLYQFNASQKGWDGTLNAVQLPSNDYWFIIELENNKLVKGHFTLKR